MRLLQLTTLSFAGCLSIWFLYGLDNAGVVRKLVAVLLMGGVNLRLIMFLAPAFRREVARCGSGWRREAHTWAWLCLLANQAATVAVSIGVIAACVLNGPRAFDSLGASCCMNASLVALPVVALFTIWQWRRE